ncbi:MAG: hypothetical protein K2N69_00755 [Helicobacter sp.]|nr:hypothetical protein [Helicobacter sp.]
MNALSILATLFAAMILCGCSLQLQRQMTAVEIGCKIEQVVFPNGEISWYEFMPQYWEANCGDRKYVCQPFTGIAIFQAPSAKCKEIIP